MADVSKLVPKIIKWEGRAFTNDPTDKGGETKEGITISTWKAIGYDKDGDHDIDVNDLKLITDEDFKFVLKVAYWDHWKADSILNQSIADAVVDWLWGSGGAGIKGPQRLLGVSPDGVVGINTIRAINAVNPQEFFDKLIAARKKFLNDVIANDIAAYETKIGRTATQTERLKYTDEKYRIGWFNRLADFSTFTP